MLRGSASRTQPTGVGKTSGLGSGARSRGWRLLGVLLLEAVDAAGRVDQLLLAGEEGMALRADVDAQFLLRGARGPGLAARAVDRDLLILRMNVWFHELTSNGRMLSDPKTGSIGEKFWQPRQGRL